MPTALLEALWLAFGAVLLAARAARHPRDRVGPMTEREARIWKTLIYIVLVFLLPIPTIPWLAWRATAPKSTGGRS